MYFQNVFVCAKGGFGAQLESQNSLRFLCNDHVDLFWDLEMIEYRKVSIHNFALYSLTNNMCLSKMPQHQVAEEVRTSDANRYR